MSGASEGKDTDDKDTGHRDDDRAVERSEPHVNAAPGAQDAELHPDRPDTMQNDHEDAPGRQRYADARPGDYGRDFQTDESGSHPVKKPDEEAVDEDGIPDIAATEPHEKR